MARDGDSGIALQGAAPRASHDAAHAVDLIDDIGTRIQLAAPAARVVSLIPSATETLIAVGAAPQIVGRTRYDVDTAVARVPSVGGGTDPSIEAIVALHPDIVISWASDKRQSARERLMALGIPTFVMKTEDTTDVFRGVHNLGMLTGHDSTARAVAARVRATLDSVRRSVAALPPQSMLYVVFPDPPMTVGPASFIGQLIALAGGRSVFADASSNWPTIAMEEIVRRDPDVLIVPEGEFKDHSLDRFRKLAGWRTLRAVREGRIVTVDADLMSRPSPSIARAAVVLRNALHPSVADSLARQAEAR